MKMSQTQKNIEKKRIDAKMSVDGYMEKHAYPSIDSRAFNNYTA